MKRVLVLIIILSLIQNGLAVKINEVELNPVGSDSGNEWIELYSSSEVSLINWTLKNKDNQTLTLNETFSGYLIINLIGQWLDNSDEKVFLYNQNELIDETILFSDSNNDNKTWQYCNNAWSFTYITKNSENNCSTTQITPPQNNQSQTPQQVSDSKISIKIEFDENNIINGEEFKIKIKTYNLKSQTYNFKIWIKEEDKGTAISDRYGEDSSGKEVWKSGNYYIYNLFEGPGNKIETVQLKIRKDYMDFSGDAEICFKIEGVSESEDCESIEILEKKEVVNKNNTEEIKTTTESSELINSISGEVIKLGNSESKETITNNQKNANKEIIYESKNEKIKIYAIIGFATLCLGLVILLLFNKLN
jgi:hypothetical protein